MTYDTSRTQEAPEPVAEDSQACARGPILVVAGQVGVHPATGRAAGDDVVTQTEQAMCNLGAILDAAGASWADVVRMDCYLTSTDDLPGFNEVYARWFPPPDPPARTTVVVGLAAGLLVEVTALAVRAG